MIQMGVFVKRRQGIKYLYVLAGNSQYFLGRMDDPSGLNIKNLLKAAGIIDKNFDKTLEKYLADMQERVKYMPEGEGLKYTAERLEQIGSMLERAASKRKQV